MKCFKQTFSIPNNNSFIKFIKFYTFNMPPLYMGLWNIKKTLMNVQKIFSIDCISFKCEPLQDYHVSFLKFILERKRFSNIW